MPKMKTHRGAAKRFSKTGSGRIKFKRAKLRHNLSQKKTSTKRELRQTGTFKDVDEPKVDRLLRGG